jgi:hypothetical protein
MLRTLTSPDRTVSEQQYHHWYDSEYLPVRLRVPGISSAVRYKVKGENKWLAYFDLDSEQVLQSKEYKAVEENASTTEKDLMPNVNMDRRVYKLIYECGKQPARPPEALLAVEMTPYPSHENEFHHW